MHPMTAIVPVRGAPSRLTLHRGMTARSRVGRHANINCTSGAATRAASGFRSLGVARATWRPGAGPGLMHRAAPPAVHLHFPGVTAEGVSAILARVNPDRGPS